MFPQRMNTQSSMPVLIPRVNPVLQPSAVQPVLQKKTSSAPSDYKHTPFTKSTVSGKSKNKVEHPPPLSSAPKPSPELQLDMIIQNVPSKKDIVEYLQKRCNDLTIQKNR